MENRISGLEDNADIKSDEEDKRMTKYKGNTQELRDSIKRSNL
jgi:hypothetical protein